MTREDVPMTPFAKLYYSDEMVQKYQPLVTAIELLTETDGKDEEVQKDYDRHLKIYRSMDWCSSYEGKKYDIVFYGVSGYTGYLMMEYLKRVALKKTPEHFTFAFAGRTPSKVEEMRDREFGGTKWEDTPVMQMSYDDIYSVIDLCKSAKTIINVAGPYMLTQGDVMIDCCIHLGVHYLDISGEVPWSLRVLDLHEYAKEAGVHVIPSSASAGGYPDLGVYLMAKKMRAEYGEELRKAICYQSGGGAAAGASGGTLATRSAMATAGDDVRKKMADPFSMGGFVPDRDRWGVKYCNIEFGTGKVTPKMRGEDLDANMSKISEDKRLGIWRGPFVYSYFDTRIVRRSNMLLADLGDRPYGRNFNFMEYAMLPTEAVMQMQAARGAGGGGGAGGADGDGHGEEEEPWSDDPVRNRQKELQDLIVEAESSEAILSCVRELDGAIVISTAFHRLGKVGLPPEARADPRFKFLLERFRLRLPFFGSRQIANSLHGLGSMMYRDGGPWVEMVSVQTQRRIRDFEPQHVSNTLWACARMQLQDTLMLRALMGRAIEDISRMCPLDVSIVTWACATMKLREVEWFRAVVRARLEFADFSPQNMSNFVWGLATLTWRNDNMVLAVGREAAKKIQDFIPQELSNFTWALATLDLCDNLMLRAVAEEVDRRGDEVLTWDPQSMSNMMWAYATLAIKDDPLFRRLLDGSIARIADHDTQNLANSSWAASMVSFRCSRWLDVVAEATVAKMPENSPLHLAQLAFAFSRHSFRGERYGLLPALLAETLRRFEEFAPQSLFDVHDALVSFRAIQTPNPIERCLHTHYESLVARMEEFATRCAQSRPSRDEIASYRANIEQRDIVTMGSYHTIAFLRHFGMLCRDDDAFLPDARRQILDLRAAEAAKDPVSRSIFHRAQCAWQLGLEGDASGALADGVFESGEPKHGGPEQHGLTVVRLRHPREGDAEVQALCAALGTSVLRGGRAPPGMMLQLHLSDVPCVSCLGATLQFRFRFPGVLKVSFDRGRILTEDSDIIPRPPPPLSKKGNAVPYAPMPEMMAKRPDLLDENGEVVDRSLLRRAGPDCRDVTSFYGGRGPNGPRRTDGAHCGGEEHVPHKVVKKVSGGSHQTFYFSARPDFYSKEEYDG
mmetsp:Transcript_163806/g.525348  ORF Transcript_163806/g.525348 Transcript_163806/m.525348 type:complete len:1129 (+) Transcript_163806:75-3461(+)